MREGYEDKIPPRGSAREKGKKEVGKSIKTKFQLSVIAVLGVFFAIVISNRAEVLSRLEKQLEDTDKRIKYQHEYAENLRRDEAYLQSDDFIRRIAYERFGLVADTDTVFERRRR
jgi:cell division protein FtsB